MSRVRSGLDGEGDMSKICRVMDLDRFGDKCTVHGWDVQADCWESERTQTPAPEREPQPGSFLIAS